MTTSWEIMYRDCSSDGRDQRDRHARGREGSRGRAGTGILLLHGFPELWYSWRHQIIGLAACGYRAIAPDLRGYGDTSAPPSVNSYTLFHLVGDVVALLDALELPQV
uniref:AB hydrolase-1 domain-containing protein n=1 Tax=Ananas comosus var. bracteatus TaxID=296719 RepID=A0A6V7NF07_ANACO|nr:unnamed protein product [Ananas comosus var. bracteatus]